MTLAIAIQPLFLRNVLQIDFENAGVINANIQVVTEILDLALIGYLGFLSDRYGRIPILVAGFLVAATGAFFATFSLQLGLITGISGLVIYYLMRIIMSLGTGAVWPQIANLAGDFSSRNDRVRLMTNTVFMMALGGTIVYAVLMQIPPHAGLTFVMLLTSVIALIGAWLGHNFLVDVAPKLPEKKIPLKRIWNLLRSESRMRLSFMSAFFSRNDMAFIGIFLMLWFIYFADIVGISQEEAAAHAGLILGLIGLVVLGSIPFWGKVIVRYGKVTAIAAGMACSGFGLIGMSFVVNPFEWNIIPPIVLMALGQAGCLIAPQVLTIDLTPREILGSVMGMFFTMGGIGVILFVTVGGFLFDIVGPHAPFMFTGVGNLFIMVYAFWVIIKRSSKVAVLN